GQEVIARLDSREKVQRQLITFKTEKEAEYSNKVLLNDKEVGLVTSVCYSYRHRSPIARAYVKTDSLINSNNGVFVIVSESEKLTAERL
ncbi:MAG TPA: glycine cleavage T C-terminal barrel domain-containing protein, partial [bacterium]|nr:glycine cleavage T C-terminal barrel domain-containing protein [bacterium]